MDKNNGKMAFDFKIPDLNLDNFDLKINLSGLKFDSRYIKPPKQKERKEHQVKYAYAEKLAEDIVIEKDSRIFGIINGSFIFGDFIEALIVKNNWHVKEMTISTLSMSDENVDSLKNLFEGEYLDKLNLIVSTYFFANEYNRGTCLINYAYEQLDIENKFQLSVCATHCKTCIFETHCGLKVVVHGSANLRTSDNLEQIMIEENETLYDFNLEYQQQIIEKFKTINKDRTKKEAVKMVRNKTMRESVEFIE